MDPAYYQQMAHIQQRHWWYEGRRTIIDSILKRLSLLPSAEILEAGCGTGANLSMLGKFGKVVGFEPHEFAAEKSGALTGYDIRSGSLPGDVPFAGPFDCIGAFDVIEHIDDDLGSVKKLLQLLKPGGHLVLTVPAHQWLWSEHDEINHHKRRYSRSRLKKLLQDAGCDIRMLSYYNMFLFPFAALIRIIKSIFKVKDKSDVEMPGSDFVNRALTALFSSERFILSLCPMPMGLSLIAVCRRAS